MRGSATTSDRFSSSPIVLDATKRTVEKSDSFTALDIELTTNKDTILVGFIIRTTGPVQIKNSYYSVSTDQPLKEIELVLATTTFKKEKYITSNIDLVKSEILDSADPIADHFNMHVIDNGRTLDSSALENEHVHIHPNQNVGGAGGFTYGMILAKEQKPKATHVLLMDDDVAVSPESIKRTYNLLRIVNKDYSEAMISGAMLNYGIADQQWEDTGYMTPLALSPPQNSPYTIPF